jgi:hypothetical protein
MPFGKGRKFLSDIPTVVDHVIGGWQMAGTVIWMSGRPFTVYSGVNSVRQCGQSTADCNGCSRNSGSLVLETGRNFWFDAATRSQFAAPAPGSIGNTGRNFFLAPNYFQWDSSLAKEFRITERVSFHLRLDARNVLNNPSFDNPTAVITSTTFGRINDSVTNNARRIQLSGKIRLLRESHNEPQINADERKSASICVHLRLKFFASRTELQSELNHSRGFTSLHDRLCRRVAPRPHSTTMQTRSSECSASRLTRHAGCQSSCD